MKSLRQHNIIGIWFYDELLPFITGWADKSSRDKKMVSLDSIRIQANSLQKKRLLVFKRNPVCVNCGIVGSIWILEKFAKAERKPHFNLYAYSKNKDELQLMTLDHIKPVSKGGANDMDNLATMCVKCNANKTNHHSIELESSLREKSLRLQQQYFYDRPLNDDV